MDTPTVIDVARKVVDLIDDPEWSIRAYPSTKGEALLLFGEVAPNSSQGDRCIAAGGLLKMESRWGVYAGKEYKGDK